MNSVRLLNEPKKIIQVRLFNLTNEHKWTIFEFVYEQFIQCSVRLHFYAQEGRKQSELLCTRRKEAKWKKQQQRWQRRRFCVTDTGYSGMAKASQTRKAFLFLHWSINPFILITLSHVCLWMLYYNSLFQEATACLFSCSF